MSAKSRAAPRLLSEYRRKPGASMLLLSRSQTATCCATRSPVQNKSRSGGWCCARRSTSSRVSDLGALKETLARVKQT